jgi:hypothetical protein
LGEVEVAPAAFRVGRGVLGLTVRKLSLVRQTGKRRELLPGENMQNLGVRA